MGNFDASKYVIQLKGKNYLETKYRLMWMRAEHPDWRIGTEIVSLEPPLVKATVYDTDGAIVATGHGGAQDKGNAVWSGRSIEKAETAAIGRALAHAGYGTQFLESDANHLADSPTEPRRNGNGKPSSNVDDAKDRLGSGGLRRWPAVEPQDDLRNRDTAADFIANTRKAGWGDADVLAALGVSKLSEWTAGRKAAGERLQAWQAGKLSDGDDVTSHDQRTVFEGVKHLFDEKTDAGKWKHCANTYNKLIREGVVRAGMSNDQVIAKITAYKSGAAVEDLAAVEAI